MSTTIGDSSTDYFLESMPVKQPAAVARPAEGGIWLDGDVLACACPDCGAPMSIRLWLMVADCWLCSTNIELTEEQEQEALRLLREREGAGRKESAAAAIVPTMRRGPRPAAVPGEPKPQPVQPRAEVPESFTAAYQPRRVAASRAHRGTRARVRDIYEKGVAPVLLTGLLKDLPAWLVSLVVHLVLMLLLAMWTIGGVGPESITLATAVSRDDEVGEGDKIEEAPIETFEFEEPGAVAKPSTVEETGAPSEPEMELPMPEVPDVSEPVGLLPGMARHETDRLPPAPAGHMFSGRDPMVRAHMVTRAGGTSQSEAAVARALKFLSRHQNADGSWSLRNFHKAPGADGKIGGRGSSSSDVAGTALSLLPFLGAAQTHEKGEYQQVVANGLNWIVEHQKEDGDLRGAGDGRMYAHGQAAIVLSEAFALTGDEQLRDPAQRALNFIVKAQHPAGGWRYQPGEAGDTSVVGWQLMALQSGKQIGNLHVPRRTFEAAGLFLDSVKGDKIGSRYAYQAGRPPTEVMTAEALLCRLYLGWPADHPSIKAGVKYLLKEHPPDAKKPHAYYWYYATQVMHHVGGDSWKKWNSLMRDTLIKMQQQRGSAAGSWDPQGGFSKQGGRLYMTALATCILEVYYRHMPLNTKEILPGLEW